jgi:hypothetical protein
MMPTPTVVTGHFRREAVMGHSKQDRPGLGLTLALVFVLLFSVYASVASAQTMTDAGMEAGNRLTMPGR